MQHSSVTTGTVPIVTFSRENVTSGTVPDVTLTSGTVPVVTLPGRHNRGEAGVALLSHLTVSIPRNMMELGDPGMAYFGTLGQVFFTRAELFL